MNKQSIYGKAFDEFKAQWHNRHCPPSEVRLAGGEEMEAHKVLCDVCRNNKSKKKDVKIKERVDGDKTPQPGEIWTINPEFGGWSRKKGVWVNPPMIYVIKHYKEEKDFLPENWLVALVGESQFFKGEGDIPIKYFNGYVETWTAATVLRETFEGLYASRRFTQCYPSVAKAAKAQKKAEWDGKEPVFTTKDQMPYRDMEIEVMFHISSPSFGKIMLSLPPEESPFED